MRESEAPSDILSREELTALLESLAGDQGSREWTAPTRNRALQAALQQANEDFAAEQSRQLSNTHQCLIKFNIVGIREIDLGSFAEMLLPTDRISLFSLDDSGVRGCLLISRPLLFSLMCLNFGALPGARKLAVPDREYTRIELRFLRTLAMRLLERLREAWSTISRFDMKWQSLQPREWAQENGSERGFLCSFDVRGFNEVCRVRAFVPAVAFGAVESLSGGDEPNAATRLEECVLDMPLDLMVEAASRDLPLVELSRLKVGESFELRPPEGGQLTVKIGGRPKFRAVRGRVGRRVAVQLTERV